MANEEAHEPVVVRHLGFRRPNVAPVDEVPQRVVAHWKEHNVLEEEEPERPERGEERAPRAFLKRELGREQLGKAVFQQTIEVAVERVFVLIRESVDVLLLGYRHGVHEALEFVHEKPMARHVQNAERLPEEAAETEHVASTRDVDGVDRCEAGCGSHRALAREWRLGVSGRIWFWCHIA